MALSTYMTLSDEIRSGKADLKSSNREYSVNAVPYKRGMTEEEKQAYSAEYSMSRPTSNGPINYEPSL